MHAQTAGGGGDTAAAACSSVKARIMLRAMRFGMSALLSSVAPVFGEVSLVRVRVGVTVRVGGHG